MIVPSNRLLSLFGFVVLPASLFWALSGLSMQLPLMIAGLLVLLLVADAWLARNILDEVSIETGERLNLTHNREGTLELVIVNSGRRRLALDVGLSLPEEITTTLREQPVTLPPEARGRHSWPLTPQRRGVYPLGRCYLRGRSPFGLWHRQGDLPLSAEAHVYPNMTSDRKYLAALFLNRGLAGFHLQRQVGQGREFEKLREYLPGDSLNDIHWRATAKRGQLVTKEYQIERTQEIYVVIDSARLSARQIDGQSVLERYITASLALNLVAQQQGDLFGLVTFSNKVDNFIKARAGMPHFRICQDALIDLQPDNVNPDFAELATFLSLRLRRRSLLLFLTALDESALAEQFVNDLGIVNNRHLVLVNMIRPDSVRPLFSGDKPEHPAEIYRHLGGHMVWQGLRELGRNLATRGVDFNMLGKEELAVELVTQYLNVKRRQVL